jgi:CubicO group peptidase (beta-lactamase class C family)
MPIDFTRVAILFLVQTGQIAMEDRIGNYFDNVPDDKREITIASLMEGSSGLANFHHRDSDADRDLSWIDRDTAIHRILEQPLLFEPGKGKSHSHSAFGLLAAIIEIATGKDYGDYLHEILFDPAGMRRTGFYGESLGLADSEFAVGYGEQASTPNIPPRWGPASWLVIGSGGMVSSIADMQRGFDHVNSGKLLTGDRLREYQRAKLAIGGTNRGFFFLRIAADDGSVLFLASNAMQDPQEESDLVESLISMLRPDAPETASDP